MMKLEWVVEKDRASVHTTVFSMIAYWHLPSNSYIWIVYLLHGSRLDVGYADSLKAAQLAAEEAARRVLEGELGRLG